MSTKKKSNIIFTKAMTFDDLANKNAEACTISAKMLKAYLDSKITGPISVAPIIDSDDDLDNE